MQWSLLNLLSENREMVMQIEESSMPVVNHTFSCFTVCYYSPYHCCNLAKHFAVLAAVPYLHVRLTQW
jgi:hypothetical protein